MVNHKSPECRSGHWRIKRSDVQLGFVCLSAQRLSGLSYVLCLGPVEGGLV
jgi:hypothetical protein